MSSRAALWPGFWSRYVTRPRPNSSMRCCPIDGSPSDPPPDHARPIPSTAGQAGRVRSSCTTNSHDPAHTLNPPPERVRLNCYRCTRSVPFVWRCEPSSERPVRRRLEQESPLVALIRKTALPNMVANLLDRDGRRGAARRAVAKRADAPTLDGTLRQQRASRLISY